MKITVLPLQILVAILWYTVPAMSAVPGWLIFLPAIVFAVCLPIIILAAVGEVVTRK